VKKKRHNLLKDSAVVLQTRIYQLPRHEIEPQYLHSSFTSELCKGLRLIIYYFVAMKIGLRFRGVYTGLPLENVHSYRRATEAISERLASRSLSAAVTSLTNLLECIRL